MFQRILNTIINKLALYYDNKYNKNKSWLITKHIVKDIINSNKNDIEILLNNFIDKHWQWALKDFAKLLREIYNIKLSENIYEWDNQEISKLKYLLIAIVDIEDNLD